MSMVPHAVFLTKKDLKNMLVVGTKLGSFGVLSIIFFFTGNDEICGG